MPRHKGIPNRLTEERAREAAKAIGKPLALNAKLGKEVLEEAMMHFRALAARYQPRPDPTDAARTIGDEKKFEHYMKLAGDMAGQLAPYQSPRLAAVAVQQLPPMRPEEMTDAQLRAAYELAGALTVEGSAGSGNLKTIN